MTEIVPHETIQLAPNQIRADGGTQSRTGLNVDVITEYSMAMMSGAAFPPIVVYYDGTHYWLVDGFHRVAAARRIDRSLSCIVHQGTQRDAVLASLKVNATHGLRRSAADKRQAVERLLNDEEWGKWSNRAIADAAAVSKGLVDGIVREREAARAKAGAPAAPRVVKSTDGKERNVTNIAAANTARPPAPKPAPARPAAPPPPVLAPKPAYTLPGALPGLGPRPAPSGTLPPSLPGLGTPASAGLPPSLPGLGIPAPAAATVVIAPDEEAEPEELGSVAAPEAPERAAFLEASVKLLLATTLQETAQVQHNRARMNLAATIGDQDDMPRVVFDHEATGRAEAAALLELARMTEGVQFLMPHAKLEG
jgi:hypothetical protein